MNESLLTFFEKNFYTFLFIFLRFLFLFFLFPLFASPFFPAKVKLALSLLLALALLPVVSIKITPPRHFLELLPYLFGEFLLMFLLSLFLRFILGGIQLGGEIVGIQLGFGISQTFDPLGGVSIPILSQFIYLLFILFFFTFDFHHYLILFVVRSFTEIPPGTFALNGSLGEFLLKKSSLIFDISVKILAPVMIFMLLLNIVLAIVSRVIPQMNVLFVSFPLTLGLGLLFFGLMLFLMPVLFKKYLGFFGNYMQLLLKY